MQATRIILAIILLGTCASARAADKDKDKPKSAPEQTGRLTTYDLPYHILKTDIDSERAKEVGLRMTRMVEEYRDRTRDFSGTIKNKLPFYLYRDADDYYDAGGMPGSGGVYNGRRLMAIAGDDLDARTWHIIQHEGFHQFADAVIGGEIPAWANEGLAEYFGEAVFTGDGFVSGVIPQFRLERIQKLMKNDEFLPMPDMMLMTLGQWNREMRMENYDQAWSMTHYLAHGENGKHQKAFGKFMIAIGKRQPWEAAWQQSFGSAKGFEERWRKYWLDLPENPTQDLYAKAAVATITSFVARAVAKQQTFDSFDEFLKVASDDELKYPTDDWLPPPLLHEALEAAPAYGKWTIEPSTAPGAKLPRVVLTMEDGRKIVGSFTLKSNRIDKVVTKVDPAKK
jgi:hypothetical protein